MADRFIKNLAKPLLNEERRWGFSRENGTGSLLVRMGKVEGQGKCMKCFPSQHFVFPETTIQSPQVGRRILKVLFLCNIQPVGRDFGIAALGGGARGLEQSCSRLGTAVMADKAGESLRYIPIERRLGPDGGMVVAEGAPKCPDRLEPVS